MSQRQRLKSVLHNFLGTFASRYSDYSGYWIFGFLIGDLTHHSANLLGEDHAATNVQSTADQIARQRFREQLAKAGLAPSCVREARLEYQRLSNTTTVDINGTAATAHELVLRVRVVTDLGRVYERTQSLWVAPHDDATESRRAQNPR